MPARPSVVVLDPYLDDGWIAYFQDRFTTTDLDLTLPVDPVEAADAVVDADVVIATGRRPMDAAMVDTLQRAVGILCLSTGMDQVDAEAAARAGIPVTNVPDYCSVDVADHAMALLLAAQRRLVPIAAEARRGNWDVFNSEDVNAIRRLDGQTLGVLGVGRIGRLVCRRAQAFGFRVVAYDPSDSDPAGLYERVSLERLAEVSDAVVLCAALTESSRHTLSDAYFAHAKRGQIVVNVARGGLVDEAALLRALDSGAVSVAALDVREVEPPPSDDPLAGRPDVIVTTHVAGMSDAAFDDLIAKADVTVHRFLLEAGRLASVEEVSR